MPRPPLLSCEAVSKAFGTRSLFDGLTFGLFEGDQAGLVGPNGSGKSTLLKILAGVTTPDAGTRSVRGGVRVGFGPQDPVVPGRRTLPAAPDVLLMYEPTNPLDVEGILWLEGVLTERARACLVVSHDRYFLEHVATRMLELNRAYPDGLWQAEGRYSEFLARRDKFLRGQAGHPASPPNTPPRPIEWLRPGAQARSAQAQGRTQEA